MAGIKCEPCTGSSIPKPWLTSVLHWSGGLEKNEDESTGKVARTGLWRLHQAMAASTALIDVFAA
ncbi:uncharacterized protein N7459_001442 [Penicillium hispanicum]|uniref:uncharacterized protein n=1 Tax=Penicillium hispanicum TaxID=1080232 RepID=UPI002541911A|nr:uncharacterized protein N7459_001442 [Penicillium hispanicum]KAJ5595234.1 hypothetical protein N7459_001442 [Penicillium hispanicum]